MKNIFTLFLITFLSTLLISCNKEDTYKTFEDKHLKVQTTFTQKEKEYYVYFYKEGCPGCEKVKDLVFKQAKNTTLPLYFINEKDVGDLLLRTNDENHSNYDARAFNEIRIYGFPTIILINNGRVIAEFVGSGEITKELGS